MSTLAERLRTPAVQAAYQRVHAVAERAGVPMAYASESDIKEIEPFIRRVAKMVEGDPRKTHAALSFFVAVCTKSLGGVCMHKLVDVLELALREV